MDDPEERWDRHIPLGELGAQVIDEHAVKANLLSERLHAGVVGAVLCREPGLLARQQGSFCAGQALEGLQAIRARGIRSCGQGLQLPDALGGLRSRREVSLGF